MMAILGQDSPLTQLHLTRFARKVAQPSPRWGEGFREDDGLKIMCCDNNHSFSHTRKSSPLQSDCYAVALWGCHVRGGFCPVCNIRGGRLPAYRVGAG